MSLQNTLILCGIIAVVLLVLQFFTQVHKIKRGRSNIGQGRVFVNWLLVILIIVGFGGGGFMAYRNSHHAAAQDVKTPSAPATTTDESADKVSLEFDRKVELNSEGQKKVTFNVSPNTKVKIVGHYSNKVFKTFNGKTEFTYTFDQAGTYDIIATNGSKKVVKKLVVKDHSDDDSSSDNSSSDSNSSSSNSSSSSRSSNNNNSNNSNSSNSNRSQSNGGSSSNSNGGSSNSGYSGGSGSSYHGGGGASSNYTPSRPAATPSAPSSNGTGAMTGGSY